MRKDKKAGSRICGKTCLENRTVSSSLKQSISAESVSHAGKRRRRAAGCFLLWGIFFYRMSCRNTQIVYWQSSPVRSMVELRRTSSVIYWQYWYGISGLAIRFRRQFAAAIPIYSSSSTVFSKNFQASLIFKIAYMLSRWTLGTFTPFNIVCVCGKVTALFSLFISQYTFSSHFFLARNKLCAGVK